jgi:chemotaxis methyl-accepting protein methylase
MDIILCRNQLHLLDQETRRKIFHTYLNNLKPGGYIMLQKAWKNIQIEGIRETAPGIFKKIEEFESMADQA